MNETSEIEVIVKTRSLLSGKYTANKIPATKQIDTFAIGYLSTYIGLMYSF